MPHQLSRNTQLAVAGALGAGLAALYYAELLANRQPYHNSILTREKWLLELLTTHNRHRFYEQLGISKDTFIALVSELEALDLISST